MVAHYDLTRLRRNSERPAAIIDVLVATSGGGFRTADLPLGLPTCSARSRRRLWALYPAGEEVVVVYPDGAVAGRPVEVAAELARLAAGDGDGPLDVEAVRAIRGFLVDGQGRVAADSRRESSSASRPVEALAAARVVPLSSGQPAWPDRGQPTARPAA